MARAVRHRPIESAGCRGKAEINEKAGRENNETEAQGGQDSVSQAAQTGKATPKEPRTDSTEKTSQ